MAPSSAPESDSGMRDHHTRGSVGDFLQEQIQSGSKRSIVSASFTISAFQALHGRLEAIDALRFRFGEPRFAAAHDPEQTDTKSFSIEDSGLALHKRLQQKPLEQACTAWIAPTWGMLVLKAALEEERAVLGRRIEEGTADFRTKPVSLRGLAATIATDLRPLEQAETSCA